MRNAALMRSVIAVVMFADLAVGKGVGEGV